MSRSSLAGLLQGALLGLVRVDRSAHCLRGRTLLRVVRAVRLRVCRLFRIVIDPEPGVAPTVQGRRLLRGVLEVRENAPLGAPARVGTRSTVAIRNFGFKPATLRTTAGTVVTWRNFDPAPHSASAKQFSSPQLGKGAAYRRRFAQPGTYSCLCALHPGMRGTVVVVGKAAR